MMIRLFLLVLLAAPTAWATEVVRPRWTDRVAASTLAAEVEIIRYRGNFAEVQVTRDLSGDPPDGSFYVQWMEPPRTTPSEARRVLFLRPLHPGVDLAAASWLEPAAYREAHDRGRIYRPVFDEVGFPVVDGEVTLGPSGEPLEWAELERTLALARALTQGHPAEVSHPDASQSPDQIVAGLRRVKRLMAPHAFPGLAEVAAVDDPGVRQEVLRWLSPMERRQEWAGPFLVPLLRTRHDDDVFEAALHRAATLAPEGLGEWAWSFAAASPDNLQRVRDLLQRTWAPGLEPQLVEILRGPDYTHVLMVVRKHRIPAAEAVVRERLADLSGGDGRAVAVWAWAIGPDAELATKRAYFEAVLREAAQTRADVHLQDSVVAQALAQLAHAGFAPAVSALIERIARQTGLPPDLADHPEVVDRLVAAREAAEPRLADLRRFPAAHAELRYVDLPAIIGGAPAKVAFYVEIRSQRPAADSAAWVDRVVAELGLPESQIRVCHRDHCRGRWERGPDHDVGAGLASLERVAAPPGAKTSPDQVALARRYYDVCVAVLPEVVGRR